MRGVPGPPPRSHRRAGSCHLRRQRPAPCPRGADRGCRAGAAGAIDGIYSRGQTNLSGGWLKGVESLQGERGDGPRKVLLLTDGLANVGITGQPALVEMATKAAAADNGVGTTTIGFGADFAEELLTAMADAGRGNAYFAETPDE